MKKHSAKHIQLLIFVISLITHGFISYIKVDKNTRKERSKRITLNLKKVRDIGVKDSRIIDRIIRPAKKQKDNLFKKFAVAKSQRPQKVSDQVSKKHSSIKKGNKSRIAKKKLLSRVTYVQQRLVKEAISQRSDENPLFNKLDYNVKFIPPKGIPQKELNEFEKVFYSFYKRVAIKYINSVNSSIIKLIEEKPYLKAEIQGHKPSVLTAMIRYDLKGNAEVIKIIKSSNNDDLHNTFEKILKKMNKIPNVSSKLKDSDGKYTAFFQIGLNNK